MFVTCHALLSGNGVNARWLKCTWARLAFTNGVGVRPAARAPGARADAGENSQSASRITFVIAMHAARCVNSPQSRQIHSREPAF